MNRTQAAAIVDDVLDTNRRMYADGRCPSCEVVVIPRRDTLRPGEMVD
jgi:hypothetical protein